jgi:hypothetical protein
MKKWYWSLLLVPVACFVFPLCQIQVNLWRGERAERVLVNALREKYPAFTFTASHSYETPRAYLRAFDVKDPAKQNEIRDWLVEFKSQGGISIEVWLTFNDGDVGQDSLRF